MHLNNLSLALQNYQIGATSFQPGPQGRGFDSQPQQQFVSKIQSTSFQPPRLETSAPLTRDLIVANRPRFNSTPPHPEMNPRYQSCLMSTMPGNYPFIKSMQCSNESMLQRPSDSILQHLAQKKSVSPFENLQQLNLVGNRPQQQSIDSLHKSQQKMLAFQQQQELQKQQLQCKMEAIIELEKKLIETKNKKVSANQKKKEPQEHPSDTSIKREHSEPSLPSKLTNSLEKCYCCYFLL